MYPKAIPPLSEQDVSLLQHGIDSALYTSVAFFSILLSNTEKADITKIEPRWRERTEQRLTSSTSEKSSHMWQLCFNSSATPPPAHCIPTCIPGDVWVQMEDYSIARVFWFSGERWMSWTHAQKNARSCRHTFFNRQLLFCPKTRRLSWFSPSTARGFSSKFSGYWDFCTAAVLEEISSWTMELSRLSGSGFQVSIPRQYIRKRKRDEKADEVEVPRLRTYLCSLPCKCSALLSSSGDECTLENSCMEQSEDTNTASLVLDGTVYETCSEMPPPRPLNSESTYISVEQSAANDAEISVHDGHQDITPAGTLDYVSGVKGVQLPESSPTVRWSDGTETLLPTFLGTTGCEDNVLTDDAATVCRLAQAPMASPGSPYIEFLSAHLDVDSLLLQARDALAHGKVVVVKGFYDIKDFICSEEKLLSHFGTLPTQPLDMHDPEKRVQDFANCHVQTTAGSFLADLNNPLKPGCVLSFPLHNKSLPAPFDLLDDGVVIGWNQTTYHYPMPKFVHPDNFMRRFFALLHHAGMLTYPHHDADGDGTAVIVLSGAKLWAVINPKPGYDCMSRSDVDSLFLSVAEWGSQGMPIDSDKWDIEVIHAVPGDLIIQPPGQLHAVYTPVASVTVGGHFYSYDSMHLTELSRFIDHTHGETLTNEVHYHSKDSIMRLVLALPQITPKRKLYRRALLALCIQALNPSTYVAQGSSQVSHAELARSQIQHHMAACKKIAHNVLNQLGCRTVAAAQKELYTEHSRRSDPGPVVILQWS